MAEKSLQEMLASYRTTNSSDDDDQELKAKTSGKQKKTKQLDLSDEEPKIPAKSAKKKAVSSDEDDYRVKKTVSGKKKVKQFDSSDEEPKKSRVTKPSSKDPKTKKSSSITKKQQQQSLSSDEEVHPPKHKSISKSSSSIERGDAKKPKKKPSKQEDEDEDDEKEVVVEPKKKASNKKKVIGKDSKEPVKKQTEKKNKKKNVTESDDSNDSDESPAQVNRDSEDSEERIPSKQSFDSVQSKDSIKASEPVKKRLDRSFIANQKKEKMSIDVLFIMDITYSMEPWLEKACKGIEDISKSVIEKWKGYTIRFGFVGYRDIGCIDHPNVIDFCDNVSKFKQQLGNVKCGGDANTDYAEDVNMGMLTASKLKWKSFIRLCFLIGDAPAHGIEFHDLGPRGDNFLNDPNCTKAVMKNHMDALKALKVQNFFFVQITDHTRKMRDVFDLLWTDQSKGFSFMVGQLGDSPAKLLKFVVDSVSLSVSSVAHVPYGDDKKD